MELGIITRIFAYKKRIPNKNGAIWYPLECTGTL
jgi:hypothetical protein